MFLARIYIALKPTVNDPQGQTVLGSLRTLGFESTESVRVGKYIEVRIHESDRQVAGRAAEDMCRRLLANPVIEEYRFDLEELP
jgi:phosphoribosylformylglycinamidine synthase